MKLNYFLIFILVILGANMVSSESYQYNKQFDYSKPCQLSTGALCDSTYSCNITIKKPDTSLIVNNQGMGRNGSFYNYSVKPQTMFGEYTTIMSCGNATYGGSQTFNFFITADGNDPKTFPTEFLIIGLGYVLLLVGTFIKEVRMIRYFGSVMILVMGIITLYPGFSFINWSNLLGLSLGSINLGFGFYFLFHDFLSTEQQEEHPDANYRDED